MIELKKALLAGISFTLTKSDEFGLRIIANYGSKRLFVQNGIDELNEFEQLEMAAQAANRILHRLFTGER